MSKKSCAGDWTCLLEAQQQRRQRPAIYSGAAHHHHRIIRCCTAALVAALSRYNMKLQHLALFLCSCVAASALLIFLLICASSSHYTPTTSIPQRATSDSNPLHRHLAFSAHHASNHIVSTTRGSSIPSPPSHQAPTQKTPTMATSALHFNGAIPLSPPKEHNSGSMDIPDTDILSGEIKDNHKFAAAQHSTGTQLQAAETIPLLGPKVTEWDAERRTWLAQNPNLAPRDGRPNILLVTGSRPKACENPSGDHSLLIFMKNKLDYCRLHGIKIFYNLAQLNSEMVEYWSKLPLLRMLMLSHPEMEWLWWMDSDAMITDMTFELPMEKYEQYNLIIPGSREAVFVKRSWVGLNAGIFLIRNCQWSLDLIDTWALMGRKQGKIGHELGKVLSQTLPDRPLFDSDDQSSFIYLLLTQGDVWGSKVLLESSYCLHGYWVGIVDRFEEMMETSHPGYGDDRWPFVTHFVGCKPCGRYASYEQKRCLDQMKRAFNFADNQVLQQYGFEHKHLNSTREVVRMSNKTSIGSGMRQHNVRRQ